MRFSTLFLSAAVAISTMALGPVLMPIATAIAQEVATTKVDLAPVTTGLLGYASAAISALVAGAIGIIAVRLHSWLGINIEARHREALHAAIMTGVNAGLARVSDLIGGHAVDVKSTAVAEAVNYVLGSVPDAIKFFGLTEEKLSEMVTAKLQGQFAFAAPLEARTGSLEPEPAVA